MNSTVILQPGFAHPSFGLVLEPLVFDFMQRALVVALAASIAAALLSCWLVLVGWSLMGDAVSHAVLPGVVLAYLVGAPFALGALMFGLLAVVLIGGIRSGGRVKEDAAIGVVFTVLFALGLVLISVVPSQTDLGHILFGNLLGVGASELWQVIGLSVVVVAVLLFKRRDLTLAAFDPSLAHTLGISTARVNGVLLVLLAVTSVVGLQAVGVILVVAMLIIPGATARLLTDRFGRMLVIAPAVAAVSAVAGVYASYWLDTATGSMIVLAQGAAFALAYLFAPAHGIVPSGVRRARRRGERTRQNERMSR